MSLISDIDEISLALFLAAALLGRYAIAGDRDWQRVVGQLAGWMHLFATMAASLTLYYRWNMVLSLPGIAIGVTTFFSWMLAILYWRSGVVSAPLLGSILGSALLAVGHWIDPGQTFAATGFRTIHIVAAIVSQCFTFSASIAAMLYLWQQRMIKIKNIEAAESSLPALSTLENWLIGHTWSGQTLLFLAIITGIIDNWYAGSGLISLKLIWAVGVWIWYICIFVMYLQSRVHVKRIAQMVLVGFVFLVVSFFGISLMPVARSWG